jgi:hypothetical protein
VSVEVRIGASYQFSYGPIGDETQARGQLVEILEGEQQMYYAFSLDNGTLLALPIPELRDLQEKEEPLPDYA